jgi:hypothetical protein
MAKLEKEQAELQTDKDSSEPLLPQLETDEQHVNDNEGDENKVEIVEVPEENTCCYPDCLFSMIPGGGPQLDDCQGPCRKGMKFHHSCNIFSLEAKV